MFRGRPLLTFKNARQNERSFLQCISNHVIVISASDIAPEAYEVHNGVYRALHVESPEP